MSERKICKKYTIMVGTNDAKTLKKKVNIETATHIANNCLKAYQTAFSLYIVNGGYIHDNGAYVNEKSLAIVVIDPPSEDVINEIAKDLCSFFNQESVVVTKEDIEYYYVSDQLKIK